MDVKRIDRGGLAEAAAVQLRESILEGRLAPNTKLVETDLAATLGVSRIPVREAMAKLAQEGLVTSAWYQGYSVVSLSNEDIEELVTLRDSIERLAWSRAAVMATDEDLTQLDAIVEAMRSAVERESYAELVRLDIDFHDQAIRAAKHNRLMVAWTAIKWQVALYLLNRRVAVDDYHQIIVEEHSALVDVLRKRDGAFSSQAVSSHISSAYARLLADSHSSASQ